MKNINGCYLIENFRKISLFPSSYKFQFAFRAINATFALTMITKRLRFYFPLLSLAVYLGFLLTSCRKDTPFPTVDEPLFVLKTSQNPETLKEDIEFYTYNNGATLARVPFDSRDRLFTVSIHAPKDTYVLIDGEQQTATQVELAISEPFTCAVIDKDGNQTAYHLQLIPDTGLPIFWVETDGGAAITSKEDYIDAILAIDPGMEYEQQQREIELEIRGRGNSTWGMPKKPYRLKFKKKTDLLGFPATKNWVLLANYADKTLLRNYVAFELGNQLMDGFTPRTAFVEVYINGDYHGLYHLTDQIRVEESRVDIDELEETDQDPQVITGGYLLEIDERLDEDYWFISGVLEFPITFKSPEEPTVLQTEYITSYIREFEEIIDSKDIGSRTEEYEQYIDVRSFIDYYLISEILRNNDTGIGTSIFITKPRNGKLVMGPLWDFDIAAGNINYHGNYAPEGWWIKTVNRWYVRLFNDKNFETAVKTRWNEIAPNLLSDMTAKIDEAAFARLDKAQVHNFERWPILNEWVWPNAVVKGSYEGEVEYLKEWLATRVAWMDSEIKKW